MRIARVDDRLSFLLGDWVVDVHRSHSRLGSPVLPPTQVFAIGSNCGDLLRKGRTGDPQRYLVPGTTLTSRIEGIGEIRNVIIAGAHCSAAS